MANQKIVIGPSNWVLDADNKVHVRYRIITDDLSLRSAMSPTYDIQVPALSEIFDPLPINYTISSSTSGSSKVISLSWTPTRKLGSNGQEYPAYDNLSYFLFVTEPGQSSKYVQTVFSNSFAYVVPSTSTGTYEFAVSLPNTTKTPLTNTVLFSASITI